MSSHRNITCSCHDIIEKKVALNNNHSITCSKHFGSYIEDCFGPFVYKIMCRLPLRLLFMNMLFIYRFGHYML